MLSISWLGHDHMKKRQSWSAVM